jgi:heterogeneous nuclear ribonucleoprotein R
MLSFTGQVLECSLAKPQADQKSSGAPNLQKSTLLPSYPPHLGYGMVGGPYGAISAGYGAAGFGQVRCFSPLPNTPEPCLFSGNSWGNKVLIIFLNG